ncbi:DNA-binding protein [Poseidonibacter sp.]|uniref:DNA-binding protein n=1 Tax=Poseidonibacter sp. TaxID=2321188 RepID=UPI00359DAFCE
MERLVTTTQAAQILGLSLQGIHYRIKKNQLKSIKQDGKTFVYISEYIEKQANINNDTNTKVESSLNSSTDAKTIQSIIDVKDEQILLLKKSMKWMKKQYTSEIVRLEKNQNRIISVFDSEIQLLQSAFNEMRAIYKPQIEASKQVNEKPNIVEPEVFEKPEVDVDFITLKQFFVIMKKYNKTEYEIKRIIFNAIENSDSRFIYNKTEKKLLIIKSDFKDLV